MCVEVNHFFLSVKHSPLCILIRCWLNHFFRHQTCVICCVRFSPQSISGTGTVWFHQPDKSWKYFSVVRWISRLFSLQHSPWIPPRVPFPETTTTTTSPCLLPVPENYKVECFCFFDHSTLCPWCVHCHFWKIAEHLGSIQYQEVLLEMLKSVWKGKKKCFKSRLVLVSSSFFML